MESYRVLVYIAEHRNSVPIAYALAETKFLSLSENAYLQIVLEADEKLPQGVHIWLGDYRCPLQMLSFNGEEVIHYIPIVDAIFSAAEYNKFSATFGTPHGQMRLSKLFLNYFGKCDLELEILAEEKEVYKLLGSVEVFSEKIQEIGDLLDYLFQKEFYFWNIVSLTRATAKEGDKLTDNVFWKLCSIKELCRMFNEEFLEQVAFNKITKLTPANEVRSWSETEVVSDASLLWYIENENALNLTTVADENHFLVVNKPFRSDVVFSEALKESTDVYENRLVHWFVNEIYQFLQDTKRIVRDNYDIYVKKQDLLKYGIYTSFFKRMVTFTEELENAVEEIKAILNRHIPVSVDQIDSIQDQRLHSKPHYRSVYMYLVNWLENRQIQYYPDSLFSGLKHVSKLYEVFCLFKIFDALLKDLHFTAEEQFVLYQSTSLQFDPFSTDDIELSSRYHFEKGDVKLTVYYDTLPIGLTTASRTGRRGLRPDFVFEITIQGNVSYYIMDAKYKTINNIETFDYHELTLKYLHGLSPLNGGTFNAHALLILNPIANSGVNFYHRNTYTLMGTNPVIPVIGRLEISVDPSSRDYLSRLLEQLITISRRLA